MKSFLKVALVFSMVQSTLLLTVVDAQTFTNSSFEELTPGSFVGNAADFMEGSVAEGWEIVSGTPDWFHGPGSRLWDTNWGDYFQHAATGRTAGAPGGLLSDAIMTGSEGIGQTVSGFAAGVTYSIGFNHANGFFLPPPMPGSVNGGWEVFVDGVSVYQTLSTNDTSSPTLPFTTDWATSEFSFQATSSMHEFAFVPFAENMPVGQEQVFQWIDNVHFTQSVPEPGAGFALMMFLLVAQPRRRH